MRLFSNMLTFNRVRDGEDGKQGPMPANYGSWKKDYEYIKDEFIQPYVWQMKNGKKFYYLLVAEKSLGDDPYTNNTQGNGDIWRYKEEYDLFLARKIQADEIDVDDLVVKRLQTMRSGPRIEAFGTSIRIFGEGEHHNIEIGIGDGGYSMLKFFTHDGDLIYDIGPSGINWNKIKPSKWNEVSYAFLTQFRIKWSDVSRALTMTSELNDTYYKWFAGSNPTISEEDREKEKFIRQHPYHEADTIKEGWYIIARPAGSQRPRYFSQNTGNWVKPEKKAVYPDERGVVDSGNIYYEKMYQMKDGQLVDEWYIMWNGDKDGNQIWP